MLLSRRPFILSLLRMEYQGCKEPIDARVSQQVRQIGRKELQNSGAVPTTAPCFLKRLEKTGRSINVKPTALSGTGGRILHFPEKSEVVGSEDPVHMVSEFYLRADLVTVKLN